MTAVQSSVSEPGGRPLTCSPSDAVGAGAQVEATTTLRRLIDEADAAAVALRRALADGDGAELSMELHERLRLGARMLMAFQAQIDRAEASTLEGVASIEARLDARREMLQQVEDRIAALADRLERLIDTAQGVEVNLAAATRRAADKPDDDGPALLITLPTDAL